MKHDTPMVLTSATELEHYFDGRRMFMAQLYVHQRKRLNILMEGDRPVGGKWSFDAENRKILIPPLSAASK